MAAMLKYHSLEVLIRVIFMFGMAAKRFWVTQIPP